MVGRGLGDWFLVWGIGLDHAGLLISKTTYPKHPTNFTMPGFGEICIFAANNNQ
jgi:hypothetical protein